MKTNNIIISGGGGSGKTTLINALSKAGYQTMPEVSRIIIKEQQIIGGNKLPWCDLQSFGEECLIRMHQQLDKVDSEICFFDRGIPDIHAYFNYGGLQIPADFNHRIYNYSPLVFICPPWKEIFVNDAQRPESFEYTVHIYEAALEGFSNLGFNVIVVPKDTVENRVSYVKNAVNENMLKTSSLSDLSEIN